MKQTNNLLNETMISDQEESASNFEKVVQMIKENVRYNQQAVSMKTLTEIYNSKVEKLKDSIKKRYFRFLSF